MEVSRKKLNGWPGRFYYLTPRWTGCCIGQFGASPLHRKPASGRGDREGRTIVVARNRFPLSADEGRGEGDRG